MPLDPQVARYLELLSKANVPPTEQLTPQQARDQMIVASSMLGPAPEVHSVEDRYMPGPDCDLPVRIYRPSGQRPLPAMVYFHGGGWVVGSVQTHDGYCRALCNAAGVAIVSVDYRLAPEHKFPAAAEDAYSATQALARLSAELGIDAGRLAVGGDSAGGNLAAVTALMARDRGGPPLRFQLLIYPVTDSNFETASYLENANGYGLTVGDMRWFWKQYLRDASQAQQPYVSPLRASDLSALPPALVITAEFDPLRDEAEAYAKRLQSAGVPVELARYDGMIHGFVRRLVHFDQARHALEHVASRLKAALA